MMRRRRQLPTSGSVKREVRRRRESRIARHRSASRHAMWRRFYFASAALTAALASSANRHSSLTSRICSTERSVTPAARAADDHRHRPRARDRDVETIAAEEELQPARHVLAARRGHREEHDRRFAALKLVHRADFDAGRQTLAQARTCML